MPNDVTSWLQQLTPEQLDLVKQKLDEKTEKKQVKLSNPVSVPVKDLAEHLGLDLSTLEKQIRSSLK